MDPYKELAALLDLRIQGHTKQSGSGMPGELGTMTATGLKLDTFKHEIKDYLIADWLVKIYLPAFSLVGTATSPVKDTGEDLPGASTSQLTRYDFSKREIDDVRLELKPGLKPGDRVLAVPVNNGQEAVIMAKVVI
ncbi:hypothetical protein [Desulforamulus ruminis]|uniref:Uncharacterized protein n=1 Tax=Desulforamulus ruminis (strain ATCC 23193 / DSM 2154 / NCIMB 8452 / DL) TaxID=696281 RepID=F6DLQ6_DESRL|nr:hypothetical protein [Desulforamulus ruminis]AEG61698.1 hypothetical protein Desru_3495 [Desulforamulus ruminis DSM 2154]